jgi:hypothetical protein
LNGGPGDFGELGAATQRSDGLSELYPIGIMDKPYEILKSVDPVKNQRAVIAFAAESGRFEPFLGLRWLSTAFPFAFEMTDEMESSIQASSQPSLLQESRAQ